MEVHLEVQNKYVISPCLWKKWILAFRKKSLIKCLIWSIRGFACGDRHNLILWAKVSPCSLPGIFLSCSAVRNDVCPWDICLENYLSATTQLLLMKKWLFSGFFPPLLHKHFFRKFAFPVIHHRLFSVPLTPQFLCHSLANEPFLNSLEVSFGLEDITSEQASRLVVQTTGIYTGGFINWIFQCLSQQDIQKWGRFFLAFFCWIW